MTHRITRTGVAGASLIAVALLAACGPAAAPTPPRDEAKEVERALVAWYDAIHAYDSAGIAGALTPEFVILEDTLPYDRDGIVKEILAGRGKGIQTAELTGLRTRVRDSVAWTTMHNHEVWTPSDGSAPQPVDFLETVVLVRTGGRWLLDRYHASLLRPATPAAQKAP